MVNDFDRIEEAMNADNFPVTILFARKLNEAEVMEKLKALDDDGVVRYLASAPSDPNDELRKSTGGAVSDTFAFMLSFSKSSRGAILANEEWLKKVGYVTENDVLGIPPRAPYDYSTIKILRWWPAGLIEQFADRFGDSYILEQYVRISLVKQGE